MKMLTENDKKILKSSIAEYAKAVHFKKKREILEGIFEHIDSLTEIGQRTDYDSGYDDGYSDGYDQGYENGENAVMDSGGF